MGDGALAVRPVLGLVLVGLVAFGVLASAVGRLGVGRAVATASVRAVVQLAAVSVLIAAVPRPSPPPSSSSSWPGGCSAAFSGDGVRRHLVWNLRSRREPRVTPLRLLAAAAAVLAAAACSPGAAPSGPPAAAPSVPAGAALSAQPSTGSAPPPSAGTATRPRKVLLIAEENREYDEVVGDRDAPYLNQLAATYGTATHLDAGYPARCPSLAAYILLTSGSTAGICDDDVPRRHRLTGTSIFHQVAAAGGQWRSYAESAPGPCALDNSADGRYLVRHVPATYYVADRADCRRWAVPLGTTASGPLHDDVAAGALPAYAFVTPDACDDMHGAPPCRSGLVAAGDRWLRAWLPRILAGPDYRAGRLTVFVTWDEGTGADNHVPTLVISPATRHVSARQPFTHCSTLRTTEDLLGLPPLGCAATAPAMTGAFHL
jgi:phosphatidylinositol-3-phosphatase